jgi:hypothetical protein
MRRTRAHFYAGGPGLFSPGALFGAGVQGASFDLTDTSKLFQDSAGTVPVTANAQPIGRAVDLSPRGNHAIQATAGFRPTFQGYGLFDGVDDILATANLDLSGTNKVTVVVSALTSVDALQIVAQIANFAGSAVLQINPGDFTRGDLVGDTAEAIVDTTGPTLNTAAVLTVLFDIGGAIATDEVKVRINGAQPAQVVTLAGPAGGGNFNAAQPIRIGSNSAAPFLAGRIYRAIVIGRTLNAAELAAAERWCGAAAGIIL